MFTKCMRSRSLLLIKILHCTRFCKCLLFFLLHIYYECILLFCSFAIYLNIYLLFIYTPFVYAIFFSQKIQLHIQSILIIFKVIRIFIFESFSYIYNWYIYAFFFLAYQGFHIYVFSINFSEFKKKKFFFNFFL